MSQRMMKLPPPRRRSQRGPMMPPTGRGYMGSARDVQPSPVSDDDIQRAVANASMAPPVNYPMPGGDREDFNLGMPPKLSALKNLRFANSRKRAMRK